MLLRKILTSSAGVLLCLTAGGAGAAAPFETDVSVSIDKGIEWLATNNAFNNPSSAGEAAGLTLLALLEKRAGTDLDAPPQGYAGASDVDKGRMRKTVAYLLGQVDSTPFDMSYRDGQNMMALSLYLRTGGPDRGEHADLPVTLPHTLLSALNKVFDRAKTYQRVSGYWCYGLSFQTCDDSSTTQFMVAGLSGLRAVYGDVGKPWADATRLADLNAMAAKARQGYVANGRIVGSTCGDLGNEKGHGYNVGNTPSPQQTASGTWVQLVGGADVNDASVQNYLRWLRNRYRYTEIQAVSGDYNFYSYWYYLWSSSKALLFIRGSGVAANPGNVAPADFGKLPSGDAPACAVRQTGRDPATLSRVALFGADGPGYYALEAKDFYFDYAYTVLGYQCASGSYSCNGAPNNWNQYSRQAYALLVLQRSVGGGCIDIDGKPGCDPDGGDETAEALYCDADFDGRVTYSDVAAVGALINGKYPMGIPLTPANEWANYANSGSSASRIDANDYVQCAFVRAGAKPLKYYETILD
jgi:hypothetical protein